MRSLLLAALFAVTAAPAHAQIKIAYIDPLSGAMGATGEHGLHELEVADGLAALLAGARMPGRLIEQPLRHADAHGGNVHPAPNQ